MKTLLTIGLLAVAQFLSLAGRAQLVDFGVQKSEFTDQTQDNTAPSSASSYSVYAYVDANGTGEANSFTVTDNDTVVLNSSNGQNFSGSNYYMSLAALDGAFAPGDEYTFTASGGSLDGQSGQVPISATDDFSPFFYLTDASYSEAQDVNPNSSFTIDLGTSTAGGTATPASATLTIYGSSGAVYSLNFDPAVTTVTIPQSEIDLLTAGETYTATLTDFNTSDVTASGSSAFTNAPSSDGFTSTTNFTLVVAVPEPGIIQMLAVAALGIFLFRISRRKFKFSPSL